MVKVKKTKNITALSGNEMINIIWIWISAPWRHGALFRGFMEQNIRGRYASTFLGFLWTLLTPLANMLTYIFVFSMIFRAKLNIAETGTESYVVYLLTGLLPWLAFSEALCNSSEIFVGNANLITKVAFPLELLPLSGVAVSYLLHGAGFLMLLVYLGALGYSSWTWLWLPLIIVIHMTFTLGFVIFLASLCVFLRDIRMLLAIWMQLWFYLTPVVYPMGMAPEKVQTFLRLNPVLPIVDLYRQALIIHAVQPFTLVAAICVATFFLLMGVCFFQLTKNGFGDVL